MMAWMAVVMTTVMVTLAVKLPTISVSLVHLKCGGRWRCFENEIWAKRLAFKSKTGEMNLSIHRNLVCSLLHQTLHSILDNHRWAMEIIFKELSFKERCNWRSYWNHNHSPSLYVDDHLWDVGSCCLAHCTFHHRSLHIQVLKQFSFSVQHDQHHRH